MAVATRAAFPVLLISICASGVKALRPVPLTMIEHAMPLMASNAHPACEYCSRGAHMLPLLNRHFRVKSLVEMGVCTGMSVVHVAGDRVRTPMLRSTHAQNCPCVTHPRTLTLSAPRTPAELSTAASACDRPVPDGDGVRSVATRCSLRSPSCKCSSKEASPVSTRSPSGPGRSTRRSSSIRCHQPLTRGSCLGRIDAMRLL
jgi:hypothetical protein